MTVESWGLVAVFATAGVAMGLLSSLVGMRPRLENPLWWGVYGLWIAVVLWTGNETPFRTMFFASVFAGLLYGVTVAVLLARYIDNNPWHADRMQGPRGKMAVGFVLMGVAIGAAFGVIVAGIAWGLSRL